VPFDDNIVSEPERAAEPPGGVVLAFDFASTAIRLAVVDPAVSSSMQASTLRLSESESDSSSCRAGRFFGRGLDLRFGRSEVLAAVDGVTVDVEVVVAVETVLCSSADFFGSFTTRGAEEGPAVLASFAIGPAMAEARTLRTG
jgi:hypothetical protein